MQFRRRRCSRFSNTLRTLKRALSDGGEEPERIAGKAKVTQTMTRDSLVVKNQADGHCGECFLPEAEQDDSTDAEGKAEKILERAEDTKDGHKIKESEKGSRNSGHRQSEDGLHRSAARLN